MKPTEDFWKLCGWGLLWLGFGGCVYLSNLNGPAIQYKEAPITCTCQPSKT